MATRNLKPAKRPARAAQRIVIPIDLANEDLKMLMIEHSCTGVGGGYLTVYRGSRADFEAAGLPAAAFQQDGEDSFQIQTENVCCTGSKETLAGVIKRIGADYELEVNWGRVRPYMQGAHPALRELARMMSIDLREWLGPEESPFDRLAADPRAVDFKPAADSPQLRITPEFRKKLSELAMHVHSTIHSYGEVFVPEDRSREQAQTAIAKAMARQG